MPTQNQTSTPGPAYQFFKNNKFPETLRMSFQRERNAVKNIDYLELAYLNAKRCDREAMSDALNHYYRAKNMTPSDSIDTRLLEIIANGFAERIRKLVVTGLGTKESPKYNAEDLIKAKYNIDQLINIKKYLFPEKL
jgi:hypothetical protein